MTKARAVGFGLMAVAAMATHSASAGPTGIPPSPKIALIPVVNIAGENWDDLKIRQANKCNEYLADQFKTHRFTIVPADRVLTEIHAEKLDFSDEEQQKRSNLFQLGGALGADYILLGVITDTRQGTKNHGLYSDAEGRAEIKLWILDVRREAAIESAKRVVGESGGTRLGLDNKGSDRQLQAAVNAFRDGVKDFLARWPVKKE